MESSLQKEIDRLNPSQKKACLHIGGPLLVLAGAGSGKTKVVATRIAYLIASDIPPQSILGLTFTNKAAHEMKDRVHALAGAQVLLSTFHSLGVRILRESIHYLGFQPQFSIYDEEDVEKLLKAAAKEVVAEGMKIDLKIARRAISAWKNKLLTPDNIGVAELPEMGALYALYTQRMKEYNAVDFDDLLFLPVLLFRTHPEVLSYYQQKWQYVLVDEYQDTNSAQYEFIRLLVAKSHNIFVVGDPDQSIYSWRGANIHNILHFEQDYPGAVVVRLEQNYRSTKTILQAANHVIEKNKSRFEKSLWSEGVDGEKITHFQTATERDEAVQIAETILSLHTTKNIAFNDMVIFYRTNFQSRVFEDELLQKKIPYTIIGGMSFYLRKEIKDIFSFLRLLEYPNDLVSFLRIVNLPKRGFGEKFLEKIITTARHLSVPVVHFLQRVAQENLFSELDFSVSEKQKAGWIDFVQTMSRLTHIRASQPLHELVRSCIYDTKYLDVIDSEPETKQERRENLLELIVKADEWERTNKEGVLHTFLEEIALVSSTDSMDQNSPRISLMTLHSGKGLEFRVVFLVGLEEELFPHINAYKSHEAMEEERRLFYVGITRAKEQLYLSSASLRHLWGGVRGMHQSRLLKEIPNGLVSKVTAQARKREAMPMQKMPAMAAPAPRATTPQAAAKQFTAGQLVFHKEYGVGRIEKIGEEASGGSVYDIFFLKEQGSRTLQHGPALTPLM